jgi:hypothetical protein
MSTETKFTPGPWFVKGDAGHDEINDSWLDGRTIGSVPHGTRICDVTILRKDEGAYADARLIAAAPELYATLKAAMAFIDSHVADPDITGEMAENWAVLMGMQPHEVLDKAVRP